MAFLGFSMIFMPELTDSFINLLIVFIASLLLTAGINYAYTNFKIEKVSKEPIVEKLEVKKITKKKTTKNKTIKAKKRKRGVNK